MGYVTYQSLWDLQINLYITFINHVQENSQFVPALIRIYVTLFFFLLVPELLFVSSVCACVFTKSYSFIIIFCNIPNFSQFFHFPCFSVIPDSFYLQQPSQQITCKTNTVDIITFFSWWYLSPDFREISLTLWVTVNITDAIFTASNTVQLKCLF